ncbi:MAG: flagellar basal body P-ring formation chaperone FlgA [Pseudomonadota bacterium]
MRSLLPYVLAACAASSAMADSLVAATTIRAKTQIGPEHLARVSDVVPGALSNPSDAIGLEARVAIYAGRPIRPGDLGPPAIVERNAIVPLIFYRGGLAIQTEGRVLDRASVGDRVRALNLASRIAVTGIVDEAGQIHVGTNSLSSGVR